MNIEVRAYTDNDIEAMVTIWNQVVEDGVAFPQEECLTPESGTAFFVGRCGHICNASYAVDRESRGLHIGEKLVSDCLAQGKAHGYRVLQFNAVVASNVHARHLYERLGFKQLGTIPGGFRMKDGSYEDICPYYHEL